MVDFTKEMSISRERIFLHMLVSLDKAIHFRMVDIEEYRLLNEEITNQRKKEQMENKVTNRIKVLRRRWPHSSLYFIPPLRVTGEEIKQCTECGRILSLNQFYKYEKKNTTTSWCKDCCKEHHQQHKEYFKEYHRQHNQGNKRERQERHKRWIERYPKNKLNQTMRIAIRQSLKSQGISKSGRHWETLVGYTVEQLMARLENLFQLGMTWENRSRKWHIDHIKPLILFEFKTADDPQFRKAWALSNLQPLWAKDNLSKGTKYNSQITKIGKED